MSGTITFTNVLYDIGMGLFLLVFDAAVTYFIVDRVVERSEEKKRRQLSGLIEARLIDAVDGLLSDGLPVSCRTTRPHVRVIGRAPVALQVISIDDLELGARLQSEPALVFRGLAAALSRHASAITQPLNVAVIEPKLAPALVALIHDIETTAPTLTEWSSSALPECEPELRSSVPQVFKSAMDLYVSISARWR